MAKVNVIDEEGKQAGTVELPDSVFFIEPNMHVMHRSVKAQRNSWRQGTANTRTRSQVSGGGKKPWRQKGTGRARQGTIRAPQWRGGGVVFGPHTRSYSEKVNSKEIKLAMKSALSAKMADEAVVVIKPLSFDKPSTKKAAEVIAALGLENKRITVIVTNEDVNTYLSMRNLANVEVLPVNNINTYDLIDNKTLVIQQDCLDYIEKVLA